MSLFSKIKEGLQKTRDAMMQSMQRILNSFTKIDEDLFEQLEETMIMGDMGVETSVEICERLRGLVKERGVTDPQAIYGLIEEVIGEMMGDDTALNLSTTPSVIMVIGVNGAGKTTTIGKLCHQFRQQGKKVLVAAADTFRAAAIEQLEVWTQRAGVDIVKHAEGSDPGAVVFDGISAAVARGCDILIIDTAGRLHNKKNLMNELEKINRILTQKAEGCAIETLLVLDATTGQNAVSQAKLFSEVANITGIVLTKLDGTAKGGIVVSIKNELGIPVKLVGVGEKIEDLQIFDNRDFVRALFDRSQDEQIAGEVPEETEEALPEETETVTEEPSAEETPAEETSAAETSEEPKKKWWQREITFRKEKAAEEEISEAPESTKAPAPVEAPEPAAEPVAEPEPVEEEPEQTWWQKENPEPAPAFTPLYAEKEEPKPEEIQPAAEVISFAAPAPEPSFTPLYAVKNDAPVLAPVSAPEPAAEPAQEETAPEETVQEETPKPEKKKKGWWIFGRKKDSEEDDA